MRSGRLLFGLICFAFLHARVAPPARAEEKSPGIESIEHVVVIYAENRSFDNLFGLFPGANGIANATAAHYVQKDRDGKVLTVLPPVWRKDEADPAYPENLPNMPFRIDAPPVNRPLSETTRDLIHRFYQHIDQIGGGANDRFAAVSDAGGLVMGYYDGSSLALWKWAKEYVLCDNFFMGAFGGSFLNHFWLISAKTPRDPGAPESMKVQLDEKGRLKPAPGSPGSALGGPPHYLDGAFTPDGFAVNTTQPPYQPSVIPPAEGGDPRLADPAKHPLPPQIFKTIGDTLSDKGVSWAWYAGGWKQALADGMQPASANRTVINTNKPGTIDFQTHHQPFNYFARFAPGSKDRAEHLKDGEDFFAAIDAGTLPQVAFYKPCGDLNQHPGYTDVLSGDLHIAGLLDRLRKSPLWPKMAVIITYDENGGFWDHVAPPKGDRWGPGTRIPAIVVSPFAKRGFVDHTVYDTTSVIKFLTRRFGLEPLPGVRAGAGDLTGAFDFGR